MPLLFSLAIHSALLEVKAGMRPGELLFTFLDDVHVVASSQRIREVYNLLSEKLAIVGIQLHAGKTSTWNRAGTRPTDLEDLGPDVWNPEGPSVLTNSLLTLPKRGWRRRDDCGRQSRGCQIHSAHGRSCSSVPVRDATTSSGPFYPVSRRHMPMPMMKVCGEHSKP